MKKTKETSDSTKDAENESREENRAHPDRRW